MAYKSALANELSVGERVSLVGKVDGQHDEGVYLSDDVTRIKVKGIPRTTTGIVEVRGLAIDQYEVECESYNEFEDTSFDFSKHAELVKLYKQFPELGA